MSGIAICKKNSLCTFCEVISNHVFAVLLPSSWEQTVWALHEKFVVGVLVNIL